jgi:hypothetical protein
VDTSANQISDKFHSKAATESIENALAERGAELHGPGTARRRGFNGWNRTSRICCVARSCFEPDHVGGGRSAR